MTRPMPIVVLISGRGSNLQSLIDHSRSEPGAAPRLPVRLAAVVSNRPGAPGLERAAAAGIPTEVVDHRGFPSREAFDAALATVIDAFEPELVVLAGFMRVLGPAFVQRYAGRLVNIHPSLLPAFPGLDTHRRAIEAGAGEHGATVHFVTEGVDEGPIILQAAVPVRADDTPETLAARVLEQEHRILPQAIGWFAAGRLAWRDGRALLDGAPAAGRARLTEF